MSGLIARLLFLAFLLWLNGCATSAGTSAVNVDDIAPLIHVDKSCCDEYHLDVTDDVYMDRYEACEERVGGCDDDDYN